MQKWQLNKSVHADLGRVINIMVLASSSSSHFSQISRNHNNVLHDFMQKHLTDWGNFSLYHPHIIIWNESDMKTISNPTNHCNKCHFCWHLISHTKLGSTLLNHRITIRRDLKDDLVQTFLSKSLRQGGPAPCPAEP